LRGYGERSTQSCSLAGESMEGLVYTTNTGEFAAELGCFAVANLKDEHLSMENMFLHNDHRKTSKW